MVSLLEGHDAEEAIHYSWSRNALIQTCRLLFRVVDGVLEF